MYDRRLKIRPRIRKTLGFPTGIEMLHDPSLNKGTAFSDDERDVLRLRGLLPPRVNGQEVQAQRVMGIFHKKPSDLERYVQLISLLDRQERLFYRVVIDHIDEMMPIIYTPTVGQACQHYGHIFRIPRGLYLSVHDKGQLTRVMRNWPFEDVRMIVVTDGERILGLGDLGAQGMGIPVGKLALYTACAGLEPSQCLPIVLDVGTDNDELLQDPLYIGLNRRRVRGEGYDAFVDEFVSAVQSVFPDAVIQFEDFANTNAFRLLETYRDRVCCFNDDIQGTAAVALAGLYSAGRLTKKPLLEQRVLFFGAGEAGIGIGNLIASALQDEGMSEADARARCWFFDSKGLVVASRSDLAHHKLAFAHDHASESDLAAAVRTLRPTALIGVSGMPGSFTRPVIEAMAELNERPVIFALSNPTSKAECTAAQAYGWSAGRAIFASGSPFAPVELGGRTFIPGQGNNAYIFPGVGLGVIASGATRVTDEMFATAARTLAHEVLESDLAAGRIYPALRRIRDVSAVIAAAVAEVAYARGLARAARPPALDAMIRGLMYDPHYESYV